MKIIQVRNDKATPFTPETLEEQRPGHDWVEKALALYDQIVCTYADEPSDAPDSVTFIEDRRKVTRKERRKIVEELHNGS